MKWYFKVLQNYAKFSGRARRKEYWMFVLFNFLITMIMSVLYSFTILNGGAPFNIFYALILIYGLIIILPSWAVVVRRLHDTNRSGWMMLITLIPLIGSIWLIVLLATEGDPYDNRYGPSPYDLQV